MAVRSADRTVEQAPGSGAGALAAVSVVALGVAALQNPATIDDGPVICPFRLVTGLPCPGCGLTRSWVYLAHGDWADAAAANPFGYLTLGAALVLVVLVGAALLRRAPLPSLTPLVQSRALKVVVVGWLVFAAIRLIAVATGHGSA